MFRKHRFSGHAKREWTCPEIPDTPRPFGQVFGTPACFVDREGRTFRVGHACDVLHEYNGCQSSSSVRVVAPARPDLVCSKSGGRTLSSPA